MVWKLSSWIVTAALTLAAPLAHANASDGGSSPAPEAARASRATSRSVAGPRVRAPEPAAEPTPVVPSTTDVLIAYQRVGHALLRLQDQRGKFDCGDLMPRFRAIKLDDATATPAARSIASAELSAIAVKIERLRGIQVDQACKDNPLAAGCR